MNIPGLKLKGIVTYRLSNAETLEVEGEETVCNVITNRGIRRMVNGTTLGPYIGVSEQNVPASRNNYVVGEMILFGDTEPGVTTPTFTEKDDVGGVPQYGQWQQRFYQPAEQRTIHTICLSETKTINVGDLSSVNCYVNLASPCVQETNQILDIFYRVQFIEDNTFGVADFGIRGIGRSATGVSSEDKPAGIATWWTSAAARNDWYNMPITYNRDTHNHFSSNWDGGGNTVEDFDTKTSYQYSFREDWDWSIDRSWAGDSWPVTGKIYGAMNFYGNTTKSSLARAGVLEDSNSMIHPVFFHNKDAVNPFQNVNTLSVGEGLINVTGTWVERTWPEFYKLGITKSGDTGASEYNLSSRRSLGFYDDSYSSRPITTPFGYGSFPRKDIDLTTRDWDEFTNTKLVFWGSNTDGQWVCITDQSSGDYEIFDINSTPTLNVSSVNQCTSSSDAANADLWIASPTDGLFKIDRDLNTIQKINFVEAFIDDSKCYGVTRGRNNSIIAILFGALVISTNNGSSWEVIANSEAVKINHVDLTENGSWSRIQYITADRDPLNTLDHIAIVCDTTSFWWGRGAGAGETLQGFNTADQNGIYSDQKAVYDVKKFKCSKTGSLWVLTDGTNTYLTYFYMLEFGSATFLYRHGTSHEYRGHIGFIYDKANNPYVIVTTSNSLIADVYTKNNKLIEQMESHDSGVVHAGKKSNVVLDNAITMINSSIQAPSFSVNGDGKTSGILENIVWDHYGYNPSSTNWEIEYYGSPVANTESSLSMNRRGFNNNSLEFTGQHCYIDITPPAPNDKKTVAAIGLTVTSTQVEDGTRKRLLHLSPESLILNWHSLTPGNLSIQVNNGWHQDTHSEIEIPGRPQDANPHRVLMSLQDFRYISVWIDGVRVVTNSDIGFTLSTSHFARFVLGNSVSIKPYENFQGSIANVAVYTNDVLVNDELATYDNANHVAFPDRNFTDLAAVTYDHLVDEIYWTNGSGNLLFNKLTGVLTTSSISGSTKYIHTGLFSNTSRLDFTVDDLSDSSTSRTFALGFTPATATLAATNSQDAVKYCINVSQSAAKFMVNGTEVADLGAINYSTTYGIEISERDITLYKNGGSVGTYTDVVEIDDLGTMIIVGKLNTYQSGTITLSASSDLDLTTIDIIGHWPMDDSLPVGGSKTTHVATESLIDGLEVDFADEGLAVQNWVEEEEYTWFGSNGFVKDNIRTFGGGYSFYWKPAVENATDFSTSVVPGAGEVLMGDNGGGTGVYNPEFLFVETESRDRFLNIFLNGTEVTEYRLEPVTYLSETGDQIGTVINLDPNHPGTAEIYDWVQNYGYTGDVFFEDSYGVVRQFTPASINLSSITLEAADEILVGNELKSGSPVWIDYEARYGAILQGEVLINKRKGSMKFNSADAGKVITGRYTYVYNA